MKPLTIEISGTGVANRGAELMAIAIAERMRTAFPNCRLAVSPTFGDFSDRARHGFWCVIPPDSGRLFRLFTHLAPAKLLEGLGVLRSTDIDVILDASGFAFSDQCKWGPSTGRNLLLKANPAKGHRVPFILLPQAFGPFGDATMKTLTRQILDQSILTCARDRNSLEHIQALDTTSNVELFSDFTLGIHPIDTGGINLPAQYAAIVPNMRMVDTRSESDSYLNFLRKGIEYLQKRNIPVLFLLHDSYEDEQVIQLLGSANDISIIRHRDPRVLKFYLGHASMVIGSRFHALVGALSQGVPCIGTGWAHKYQELFTDFDCAELLISDLDDCENFTTLIDYLADSNASHSIRERISNSAIRLKDDNEVMWNRVVGSITEACFV